MSWTDEASPLRLLDLSSDSVAAYRPDSTVLYVNPTTEATFGMKREELVGRKLFEIFPGAVGNPFHRAFQEVAETRKGRILDHYYSPFGRWFENEFYVDGDVIWVLARDVTEKKLAQRRLEVLAEASHIFATMAGNLRGALQELARISGEALGDAALVRVVDADAKILEAVGVWGRTPDLGNALAGLTPVQAGRPEGEALLARAMLLGRNEIESLLNRIEVERSRKVLAEIRPHSIVIAPVRAGAQLLGVLTVARVEGQTSEPMLPADLRLLEDLASRAALAIAAMRSVADADRRKDEFLALLGHELRNPLAPILTAVHLLKIRGVEGATKEREIIHRQATHMAQLVDDLLDTSRIVRGVFTLQREPLLLSGVLSRAIEMASTLVEERRQHLELGPVPETLTVLGDPIRLAQVFSNILMNAARYTPPGGNIRIRVFPDERTLRVSVMDDGIGIPKDLQERIFEPFFQAGRPPHSQAGLGLGLPLVRSLTHMHGGSVVVESEGEGRGSCFTVTLPRHGEPAAVEPSARTPDAGSQRARRRRIPIVDDNRDALELLAESLRIEGHEVTTAVDGAHALRLLDGATFDAFILDIGLPVMDGYELARKIRERFGCGVRLAALTGYGQERDRERAIAAGFDVHFVKPISHELLRDFLRSGSPAE